MLEIIITSSLLILIIIALRFALRGKLSQTTIYALWLIAAVRLLVPVSIADTHISVMNLFERRESVQQQETVPIDPYADADTYINYAESQQTIENNQQNIMLPPQTQNTMSDTEPNTKIYIEDILVIIWAAGSAAVLIYIVICNAKFYSNLKNNRVPFEYEESTLPIYIAEGIDSPCLFGVVRPAIYLNEFAAEDKQRVKYIIVHEQMHCRHCDHIWAVVRVLCVSFYWFNPFVWLAAHLSRQDCELACDSAAIRAIGSKYRYEYGRTLIDMISTRFQFSSSMLTSTAMTSGAKTIKRRILMLKMTHKNAIWAAIAAVVILLVAAGCTFTGAANEEEKAAAPNAVSETDAENYTDLKEFPDELADFWAIINSDDPMRISNIRQALSPIDGMVMQPNEEFSFNETVGERTAEKGFKEAVYWPYEDTTEKYGSGIAQAATILYNAVFEAHLDIIEHHNHEHPIDYTSPSGYTFGHDASVVWGQHDLRFINNTGHPIKFLFEFKDDRVIANINGVSNGTQAAMHIYGEEETIHNVVFRRKTEGESDVLGRNGYVNNIYRAIYRNDIEEERQLVYTVEYPPITKIIHTDNLPRGCEYDREYRRDELEAIINRNEVANKKVDVSNMSIEEIGNHPDLQYLLEGIPMFDEGVLGYAEHRVKGIEGAETDVLYMAFGSVTVGYVRDYIEQLTAEKFIYPSDWHGELNEGEMANSPIGLYVAYTQLAYGLGMQVEMHDQNTVAISFFEQGNNMYGDDPVPKG